MPVLNTADKLMVGGVLADAAYAGTVKVWPPAPSCTDVLSEPFNNFTDHGWVGAGSIVAGRTGTALNISGSSNIYHDISAPAVSPYVTVGFAFKTSNVATTFRNIASLRTLAGNDLLTLRVETTGALNLYLGSTGGTLLGSSAAGLVTAATWNYIEFQAGVADTGGYATVRLNGVTVISFSGDTRNLTYGPNVEQLYLRGPGSGQTSQFDDLYISTGAGCTFKGDHPVFNDNVLWEPFNNFTDNAWNTISSASAIVAGRTGTAARLTAGEITYAIPAPVRTTSITVGFAYRVASVGVIHNILQLRSAGSNMNTLRVNADGSLQVHAGPAITGGTSAAGVIAANTWCYIELKITFSNTAGSIEGRVNGTTVFGGTATVDTNGGFTDPTSYEGVALLYDAATADFDDMYLTTGGGPFKGDPNPPATPSYFTGGVVTDVSTYRYHTFNTSGTLTFVPGDGPVSVEHLVVAGGGAGGSGTSGARSGGGAGGMLTATGVSLSASQTITIGAGGAIVANTQGSNGSNSSLGAVAVSSGGGGGGGATLVPGAVGGSGGGGNPGGAGTAGQGMAGGSGATAGGGGKTVTPVGGTLAAGGAGAEWPTGSGTFYAGGGGSNFAVGGAGGGGTGATTTAPPTPGTPNTGGGGGGSRPEAAAGTGVGATGGSGKVIVRYLKKAGMPALPWTPTNLANLAGWWDADDESTFSYVTGTQFSQWRDKGPNGWHVAPNVATPLITRTGTIGGRTCINNATTNVQMRSTNIAIENGLLADAAGNSMILAVINQSSTHNAYGIAAAGESRVFFQVQTTTNWFFDCSNYSTARIIGPPSPQPTLGIPHLFSAFRNGANMGIDIDGVSKLTKANASGVPTAGANYIQIAGLTGNYLLGEVIIVAGYDATGYANAVNYLKTKWGIA